MLLAPSAAGNWVSGSSRGRREQSTRAQRGLRLSKAGGGRGLEGRAVQPAGPSPSQGSKRPFHLFLPLASASLREGEKIKALSI